MTYPILITTVTPEGFISTSIRECESFEAAKDCITALEKAGDFDGFRRSAVTLFTNQGGDVLYTQNFES